MSNNTKSGQLITKDELAATEKIEGVLAKVTPTALAEYTSETAKAIALARAMQLLRTVVTDKMVGELMLLEGSPLGFTLDQPEKYSVAQVRDALLDGMLQGARPTHGEIVVISKKAFLSKTYWRRLTEDLPGLTDLRIKQGPIKTMNGGAVVELEASWRWQGQAMREDWTGDNARPVRLNSGQGVDQAIGKAEARMLRQVYRICTGTTHTGEAPDAADEPIALPPAADQQAGDAGKLFDKTPDAAAE